MANRLRSLRAPARLSLILTALIVLAVSIVEVSFRKVTAQVSESCPDALSYVQRGHAMTLISLSLLTCVAVFVGNLVGHYMIAQPAERIKELLQGAERERLKDISDAVLQPEFKDVARAVRDLAEAAWRDRDRATEEQVAREKSTNQRKIELESLVNLATSIHQAKSADAVLAALRDRVPRLFRGRHVEILDGADVTPPESCLHAEIGVGGKRVASLIVHVEDCGSDESVAVGHLLKVISQHASLALEDIKTQKKLETQVLKDPLTGLHNRRYVIETLPREVARCMRLGQPLAVLAFDVDHFKSFNDAHGHPGGDLALQTVGRVLKENIRAGDMACRQGGEEFVVVMPGADITIATQRAEMLRQAIAGTPVRLHEGAAHAITVSVGVAVYPLHAPSAQELLSVADEALYRAKAAGRDRVAVAT